MLSGILFAFVSNSLQGYMVVHTIWELWQIHIGMTPIHTLRGAIDIFTDTAMGVIGFVLANQTLFPISWGSKSDPDN
jgi:hypothetical protein